MLVRMNAHIPVQPRPREMETSCGLEMHQSYSKWDAFSVIGEARGYQEANSLYGARIVKKNNCNFSTTEENNTLMWSHLLRPMPAHV